MVQVGADAGCRRAVPAAAGGGRAGATVAGVVPRRSRRERGFGLLLSLLAMGVLVLMMGAGIDAGHVLIVRDRLQAAADEAALAAARELDGTPGGVLRARRRAREALAVLERAFGTETEAAVAFAESAGGPWRVSAVEKPQVRFVRVRVEAAAQLFFLPMIPEIPHTQAVAAVAVAGQMPAGAGADVDAGFRVRAPDVAAPAFGFAGGRAYECEAPPAGKCVPMLERRLFSDTDPLSRDYAAYAERGNGERVIVAAVLGTDGEQVGYATFLVPPAPIERCELFYAGAAPLAGVRRNGAGEPGLYEVRLVR